jgi:hypothetical protein
MTRASILRALTVGVAVCAVIYLAFRPVLFSSNVAEPATRIGQGPPATNRAVAGAPTLPDGKHYLPRKIESGRSVTQAPSPLPPETTSWHDEYRDLKARSDQGDADAASRLFRDTLRCRNYFTLEERVKQTLKMYSDTTPAESVLKHYDQQLAKLKDEVGLLSQLCAGASPEEVKEATYPAVKEAASLGNSMAATCFVDGSVIFDEASSSPSLKSDYAQYAMRFVNEGIQSGNWAMVLILESAYGSTPVEYGGRGTLGDLVQPDPLTQYSFLLLQRDGMTDRTAIENMNQSLAGVSASNHFTNEQMAAAEDWATSIHSTYFEGNPFPSGSVTICAPE